MNQLFSVKNTGLSGNLLKFIITYDFCKKNSINLIFPCLEAEKNIIMQFDHVDLDTVSFPGYICSQKHIFNERARLNAGESYTDLYKEFIKKWYPFSIKGELVYQFGNISNVSLKENQTILLDYNDGVAGYERALSQITDPFRFDPIIADEYKYRSPTLDVVSFNLKTSIPEQFDTEKRYWVDVITKFLSVNPGKTPFFVSGNNEMKYAVCSHFGVPFQETEVESKVSLREGGSLSRGNSLSVMVDLQNCVNTEFVPLERLVREFCLDGIRPGYTLFRAGKAEKFDVLVQFIKSHGTLRGS